MSEIKTIEQAAAEFVDKEMCYRGLKLLVVRQASIKSYVAGAKHQKELSDAREKLLMGVIEKMEAAFGIILIASQKSEESHGLNIYYTAEDTLSSVAKKLEGL